MDPFGKVKPSGLRVGYYGPTKPTHHNGHEAKHAAKGDPLEQIIAPEDLRFARHEALRTKTDMASVLIAYGLISAQDCCEYLSQRTGTAYLRAPTLRRAAAVCAASDIPAIARTGQIPVSWSTERTRYATALPAGSRLPDPQNLTTGHCALTTRQELGDALRSTFRKPLCEEATRGLSKRSPEFSAARRLTGGQAVFALMALMGMVISFLMAPHATLLVSTLAITGFFLSVIVLRALVLWPPVEPPAQVEPARPISDDALPVYSVLVPLLGEANMVPQLLDALCALDYPAALLDIKLILEESDVETLHMVRSHQLPGCFEILVVPPCWPQTKPKALNFALPFATGELLTTFDAEDVPEPQQLRMAAQMLQTGPPNLACVQAKLAFYNPYQNWLTRQFALEYASLFDIVLPTLAAYRLPLPLGGTSNHFRTNVLREVGGWDAHNVTEDADLGIRLDRLGYSVDVLNSTTFEEALPRLGSWLRQRSRWLKGWMQTWLVHMRAPRQTWRDMGWVGFLVFQVLMGGIVVSSLVHPFFLIAVLYGAVTGTVWPNTSEFGPVMLFAAQTIVLMSGYCVMMLIAWRACRRRHLDGITWSILSMPFYWLLLSIAGWFAVWQLLIAPFYWEKTQHGAAVRAHQRNSSRENRGRKP